VINKQVENNTNTFYDTFTVRSVAQLGANWRLPQHNKLLWLSSTQVSDWQPITEQLRTQHICSSKVKK